MGNTQRDPRSVATAARRAADGVSRASTPQKNGALRAMAGRLAQRGDEVARTNEQDMEAARTCNLPEKLVARLRFGEAKVRARIEALETIAALPDPIGTSEQAGLRPNGLSVARVRVPIGVVLMVYEARPHVTVNAGAFCLKSGNAAILRGGSGAARCNALLGRMWRESLEEAGLPADAVQVVSGTHEEVGDLLGMSDMIDLVIPRGGKGLIQAVAEQSRIPVLKHSAGLCHVYLDEGADVEQGIRVALDSKCLMPEVCNAMETLLVARALTPELPRIVAALQQCGVTVKGCPATRAAVADVEPADEADWETEYLDMVVSMKVVADVGAAIEHINRYGSHHTDAIVTQSLGRARRFSREVDSAVVLVNASTMFCDGASLGMGAEIGISTDRLHARGPMGLRELTSYKFLIEGEGQVMGTPDDWRGGPAR